MRILRRIAATGAAALALTLGLTVPAEAKSVWDDQVGSLVGFYANTSEGGPKYHGQKQPAGNWTVWVQRKTLSTGVWTLDGVYDPSHSNPGYAEAWSIRDAGYISNTTAIRLYRPTTGQYVVLCVTKNGCLGM